MTGYSAAELANMHIADWFRGEDVGYIAASMAKVFAERLRRCGSDASHRRTAQGSLSTLRESG